jgi:xylulokinase
VSCNLKLFFMSFLGLDIGTGACKAAVFDMQGKELAYAIREYSVLHPEPGMAELNSQSVINNCFDVIREVNLKITDPVNAICISSQGEAFTPVARDGSYLGNAMVSSDTRAIELVGEWNQTFGADRVYKITGHTPHPLFTLFKILWLRKNQPEIWQEARYFLCFEDLFQFKVGIDPCISWPLAGRTMMFDIQHHCWSDEILEALQLDKHRLSRPVVSGEIVGQIDLISGRKLGFSNPVIVVAGGHDQTCAALGAGVIKPGLCMYATGSVECFCPMLNAPSFTEELRKNNLCCYDFTIKGKYTTVAYSLTGGNILRWVRDELSDKEITRANETGTSVYSLLLQSMPDEPTNLLVLPYFTATGTPYFDTSAQGAILGLKLTTTKGEITRALLEGVALEMKLNLQLMEKSGMKIDSFVATGGGTRNAKWTQLKADVLNKTIMTRNVKETGCFGAAMLACSAFTKIPVEDLINQNQETAGIFVPDERKAAIYEQKFILYQKLYPVLKQFWGKNEK